MADTTRTAAEIEKSRKVAEEARESEWKGKGFLRELFLGSFRFDYIHPYPKLDEERPEEIAVRRRGKVRAASGGR